MKHYHCIRNPATLKPQRVVSHKHEGGHKKHEHRNRWDKQTPLEEYGRTPAIVRANAAKEVGLWLASWVQPQKGTVKRNDKSRSKE